MSNSMKDLLKMLAKAAHAQAELELMQEMNDKVKDEPAPETYVPVELRLKCVDAVVPAATGFAMGVGMTPLEATGWMDGIILGLSVAVLKGADLEQLVAELGKELDARKKFLQERERSEAAKEADTETGASSPKENWRYN